MTIGLGERLDQRLHQKEIPRFVFCWSALFGRRLRCSSGSRRVASTELSYCARSQGDLARRSGVSEPTIARLNQLKASEVAGKIQAKQFGPR